jgi:hypothetical protein
MFEVGHTFDPLFSRCSYYLAETFGIYCIDSFGVGGVYTRDCG